MLLIYSKAKNASGCRVEYSLKKNLKGAKAKTVTGRKKTKVTLKGLKKGQKYYVRVTPVRKRSGKLYVGIPGKIKKTGKVR